MSLELTEKTSRALNLTKKEPALVVEFDGIDAPFTGASILSFIRFDDTGLALDSGWSLGDAYEQPDQINLLSFSAGGGTSTKIDDKINPDLGIGESISSMKVVLVDDLKGSVSSLFASHEFLGKKVRIKMSPEKNHTTYPEDYVTVFRGVIDVVDFQSGSVIFNIAHPDNKKNGSIFLEAVQELDGAISDTDTTITVESTASFLEKVAGPDGTYDSGFTSYIKIDDEIIKYDSLTATTFVGCARGQLGTTAAAHDDEAEVSSFYRISDNALSIALKLMLSGWGGPFAESQAVGSFDGATNEVVFADRDLMDEYGLTVGDFLTTTLATNGANNFAAKTILSIGVDSANNTRIVLDGVTLTDEATTSAVCDFRSRYDVYPSGSKMSPDEVDVERHEYFKSAFLFSASCDFYLKETIDSGKDFIAEEIYRPYACYSVPRQTRASMGYTIPPLPTDNVKTLSTDNVISPEKILKRRTTGRNFNNSVLYKYNELPLEDKFVSGYVEISATSKAQIPVGNKTFKIVSKGLRPDNTASILSASTRRLTRYKLSAAQISNLKTTFGVGFDLEVGDKIILDGVNLKLPDFTLGTKTTEAKLYEITKRSVDLKTGDVNLTLLDTNFSLSNRYGLISPSSVIASVASNSVFTIERSYAWNTFEWKKWAPYEGVAKVIVRSADYSSSDTATLQSINENEITLDAALGVTPAAGWIMELDVFANQPKAITDLYVFHSDDDNDFADGTEPYRMI